MENNGTHLKVLFVEDNTFFIEAMLELFKAQNWTVTHCPDGKTAKLLFNEMKFDLVITDLHLKPSADPTSQSGLDLLYYVRDRKKSNVPIVVTTGLELITNDELNQYGADLFFRKSSLDVDDFFKQVSHLVATKKIS